MSEYLNFNFSQDSVNKIYQKLGKANALSPSLLKSLLFLKSKLDLTQLNKR
mgnify:CR=1 FL=1